MRPLPPALRSPRREALENAAEPHALPGERALRAPRLGGLPLVASILGHCVIGAVGVWFWSSRSVPTALPPLVEVNLEADPHAEPLGQARGSNSMPNAAAVPEAPKVPEQPGARAHTPRPDVGPTGKGGSREAQRATNLSSSLDPITLERETLNHLSESEVQRLRTARERRTRDDRRATPNPMELSFVATGSGRLALRRPFTPNPTSAGERSSARATEIGSLPGADRLDGTDAQSGEAIQGSVERASGAGIPFRSSGQRARLSAAVATSRPSVKKDRAAVPADQRALPSDTADSQQRVAGRVAALMQASTLGAEHLAPGRGGELGAVSPGSGGPSGWGARSSPSGHGAGLDLVDDPGLDGFYRRVLARVEAALYETFPRWAIAEGRGGLVVFDLTLLGNGSVLAVAVVRPSGIPEYDQNVIQALRRLPAFGPVPSAFGPRAVLRIDYDARNPIVGRNGPGPGRRPD